MRIAICLLLASITFLTYWQVLDYGFLNFDDNRYVTENPNITDGLTYEGLTWAFTEPYASNWHPVTWLSHMLDFELYGLEPAGHHLSNLLFHIANTILLFGVLLKMTGALWRSGLVAALFALHPLNVESVAWIAERKNVLSTFFWLLTMWAYADYAKNEKIKNYFCVILFFILGLMAKPMLVTLPFVLLLMDIWPLKRFKVWGAQEEEAGTIKTETMFNLIREKIPLFILAAGASITTYIVQQGGGAMRSTEFRSKISSMSNALVSYLEYLEKMVWPQELSVFYPHLGNTLPVWKTLLSAIVLVGISIWVVRGMRNAPYLAVGWFWYLGTLVPVIGIVQVGEQAMADRYMYVPLIGIFIAIAWGLPQLLAKWGQKEKAPAIFAGLLIPLMVVTWIQLGHWKNGVTLFEHAISVNKIETPSFVIVYNNYGHALASEKRYEEAAKQYRHAIKINPTYAQAHNNLGHALNELNRQDEAIAHYKQAISIEANYAEAYNNLANALNEQGKLDESLTYYSEAIRFNSDYAEAHFNLGNTLSQQGKLKDAIGQYRKALEIKPGFIRAHNNLASLLGQYGDYEGAVKHYEQAILIDPEFAKAHNNLGSTLAQQGNFEEAIKHFEEAISIDANYSDARKNLDLARSLAREKENIE